MSYIYFLLLSDRNGLPATVRFDRALKRWERFVAEYGGGRWEPFQSQLWPAGGRTLLFSLGDGVTRGEVEKLEKAI